MKNRTKFRLCGFDGVCIINRKSRRDDIGGELIYDESNNPPLHIMINCGNGDMDLVKQTILHEVMEGAWRLFGYWYASTNPNVSNDFFIMNHGEFSTGITEASKAYLEITKGLGI